MELSFDEFYSFTSTITKEAAEIILSESDNLLANTKFDGTIVTETDLLVERHIRSRIEEKYHHHGITGEEFNDHQFGAQYTWIIDPIDGTTSYFHGTPLFGTLVGLLKDGHPVYGALRLPVLEQMVVGDGDRCVINGQDAKAKNFVSWEESLLLTTDERRIERSAYGDSWNELKKKGGTFRTWGDCYGYYLLCCGKADAMFDIQLKPCDILPLLPIVTGAGCETIDFGDTPNKDLAVCVPGLGGKVANLFSKDR
jgi:fructose-1,6-bisphosphatase/inositol monophosphatase family enzyme